jgi:hypothetical protein
MSFDVKESIFRFKFENGREFTLFQGDSEGIAPKIIEEIDGQAFPSTFGRLGRSNLQQIHPSVKSEKSVEDLIVFWQEKVAAREKCIRNCRCLADHSAEPN